MDPNSKNQPIQQFGQSQDSQAQPQAPLSVPVGGAEGAPASVIPNEVPVSVSPENVMENGAEFANSPIIPSSVGQVGVVGHPAAEVHPDLKKEIKDAESIYSPPADWQTAQQAEVVRKDKSVKGDMGLYGLATEFVKKMFRPKQTSEV